MISKNNRCKSGKALLNCNINVHNSKQKYLNREEIQSENIISMISVSRSGDVIRKVLAVFNTTNKGLCV